MSSHTHIHETHIEPLHRAEHESGGRGHHSHMRHSGVHHGTHLDMTHDGMHERTPDRIEKSNIRLALAATLHCLLGCGLGEVAGIITGTALGLGMWETMGLAVVLGFILGFALGTIPLLRSGMHFAAAFKIVLVAEGLSIAVMETAEVLVQIYTPGVMEAGLTDALFWMGMLVSLAAGFAAAFPVNVVLIGRGIRHQH